MPVRSKHRPIDSDATRVKFRQLRRVADITQATMAGRMDISKSYYCELEKGTRKWSEDLCERFQKALRK